MTLEILYEDNELIAVNKPSGLLTHPYWRESNERNTLMSELKAQTGHWLYPLHRLDRPVSGIVLFGLVPQAVKFLQERWRGEETKKEYRALVKGRHEESLRFDFPLKNENKEPQEALTLADPIELFQDATLMRVQIVTGRKHQIRRHFSRRWSQVIGDRMYGKKAINDHYQDQYGLKRIFLHANRLEFVHPTDHRLVTIECPLPPELALPLEKLRQDDMGNCQP